jgi:hypothetical protein
MKILYTILILILVSACVPLATEPMIINVPDSGCECNYPDINISIDNSKVIEQMIGINRQLELLVSQNKIEYDIELKDNKCLTLCDKDSIGGYYHYDIEDSICFCYNSMMQLNKEIKI